MNGDRSRHLAASVAAIKHEIGLGGQDMEPRLAEEAASLLFAARKACTKLAELPEKLKPKGSEDIRAIQDAMDRKIDQPIIGYKFHAKPNLPLCYAPLYPSRTWVTPALIPIELATTLAIEAEIIF
jgi:hypothetical protein